MIFSIIIPTYNGGRTIEKLLRRISEFTGSSSKEIIIIDSQSGDSTLKIVEKYSKTLPIKVISIDKKDFNHGTTRNLGVQIAKGKYIYFLSQDAVPADKNILSYFMEDFRISKKAVAVFGKHIPYEETPVFQKVEIICRWERLDSRIDDRGLLVQGINGSAGKPAGQDLYDWYALSNTSCCYKREFLLKHPFRRVGYGEDLIMGKEIIDAGYIKIYDPRCAVHHSHFFNLKEYLRREEENQRLRVLTMGLRTKVRLWCKLKKIMQMKIPLCARIGYAGELCYYYCLKFLTFCRLRGSQIIGRYILKN